MTQDTSTQLTSFLDTAKLPALNDDDMAQVLQDVVNDVSTGSGGSVDFMSFSGKTGNYALGRDKDAVDPSVPYIMEPKTVVEGFTCWKGQRPVDRIEWSVYERSARGIAKDDLVDHGPYTESAGEGWKKMLGFGVRELTQSETGQQIKFSTNSPSGNNAITDLFQKLSERAAAGEPYIPLVCFDVEKFTSQGQQNFKPKLVVEAWVTRPAVEAYFAGSLSEDDLLEGKQPRKKRAAKK
tara:strand:- start:53 stop:766 length:714 start_codon:yes stop_codon:yes gene_type:complete